MDDPQRLATFFERQGTKFHRCLADPMTCENKPIRAHSVQNRQCLDLLVEDGHVWTMGLHVDKSKGPVLKFKKTGRNKASTFTGLCAQHDSDLFRPIDTSCFDPNSEEHCFLVAFRSVHRELHATVRRQIFWDRWVCILRESSRSALRLGRVA